MNNLLHIVYIPFRGVGIDNRNDKWFRERIEIFKNYTLKSLANQTTKDFTLWLSYRPQDRNNPLIKDISAAIHATGIAHISTFDGLMYHDDKFGGDFFRKLKNAARVLRQCCRNNTWQDLISSLVEIGNDKNKTLPQRLKHSLEILQKTLDTSGIILLTRIDSDDMLHKDVIDTLQKLSNPVMCMDAGYIYNTTTRQLAEWNPTTNPPFYTLRFIGTEFFDARLHLMSYGPNFRSHEDIGKLAFRHTFRKRLYCVTAHNPKNHISTIWNHPFRGRSVDITTLADFGIRP